MTHDKQQYLLNLLYSGESVNWEKEGTAEQKVPVV